MEILQLYGDKFKFAVKWSHPYWHGLNHAGKGQLYKNWTTVPHSLSFNFKKINSIEAFQLFHAYSN